MAAHRLTDPLRAVLAIPLVVYGVILVAGLVVGMDDTATASERYRLVGLVAGCLLLGVVEIVERRAPRSARWLTVALVIRLVLFALVAICDSSGVSRAVFVLVPFLAALALGVRRGVVFAVVALGVVGATLAVSPPDYAAAGPVPDALMLGIGILIALTMAAVAREAQRTRSEMVELAAEAERVRLAREIHDSLGHHLTALSLQLDKAASFRSRDPVVADLAVESARASARSALEDVRMSVRSLREHAPVFDLEDGLGELVQRLREDRIDVELTVSGDEESVDAATRATLFRAAQEALTNVRRHSGARRVELHLTISPGQTVLTVRDDGRGFVDQTAEGYGITGMRERAALVGGDVEISSGPREGTTVTVAVARP
ncbi:MAG: sensor histidine kinase [Dermatophilaceae bacterium]